MTLLSFNQALSRLNNVSFTRVIRISPKLFKLIPTEIPDYNRVLKNWGDCIIPGSSISPAKTPIRDQFRTNEVIVNNVPSHIGRQNSFSTSKTDTQMSPKSPG
jgi:hypothetical protein